jgi:hypothetical protein
MRIDLGDDFAPDLKVKVAWIRSNFDKSQYVIRDIGFLYNVYVVEFTEEKYETLYLLQYPK